ncbi:unnamed protein product, partial [Laminaria digitata]
TSPRRQGFQEPAASRTTETVTSSSTSPTEGGPTARAESKDGEEAAGGEAQQQQQQQPGQSLGSAMWTEERGSDPTPAAAAARQGDEAPAQAESKASNSLGAGAKEAAKRIPGVAPPPEFYVLLTPEIMSELLEAFIEFFAGVAAPPPAPTSDAAA